MQLFKIPKLFHIRLYPTPFS
jgi:hypothetical protein